MRRILCYSSKFRESLTINVQKTNRKSLWGHLNRIVILLKPWVARFHSSLLNSMMIWCSTRFLRDTETIYSELCTPNTILIRLLFPLNLLTVVCSKQKVPTTSNYWSDHGERKWRKMVDADIVSCYKQIQLAWIWDIVRCLHRNVEMTTNDETD